MRRVVCVLTLAGCNQVYGLDPTTVRTLEPPPCSTVQFSVPQILPEFANDGIQEFDPQLSADGEELWMSFSTPIGNNEARNLLYRSLRGSDGRFGAPQLVDLVNMNNRHTGDAALTADGLRMMFIVENTPSTLYEGIRKNRNQFPFDTIVPVLGLPGDVKSFDLTWDGLRIYFANGDGDVYMASRAARDKQFEPTSRVLLANVQFPTVSGDELEMFYVHDDASGPTAEVYRSSRASTDDPFTGEQVVLENAGDPDIAPTSSEMLVAYMGSLAIMKRTCDED